MEKRDFHENGRKETYVNIRDYIKLVNSIDNLQDDIKGMRTIFASLARYDFGYESKEMFYLYERLCGLILKEDVPKDLHDGDI